MELTDLKILFSRSGSFRTERYLGRDPEEVKRTGIIYVAEYPSYLAKLHDPIVDREALTNSSTSEKKQGLLRRSVKWIQELRAMLRVY